ncbi:MAG TPA: TIGR03862 family flavoprotein [Beijerinckiaceae bacterium]|nr:TIGR03862 family flavoprotein [Beijerinckiaceae bacterium]
MEENDGRPIACVVGGGPGGLMAAEALARAGARVTVYDQMPSLARKFLMAGRGGLNLTHSEPLEPFLARYGPAAEHLRPFLEGFTPADLRAWSETLGEPTFVGSSGRVFPKSFKASPVLRAWLRRLDDLGVRFAPRHRFEDMGADGSLRFTTPQGEVDAKAQAIVLALGGASWPRLGSRGDWTGALAAKGVALAPWRPSNGGFEIAWSDFFRTKFEGQPLKGAAFSFGGRQARGEAIITAHGLEGGGVYALSALLRDAIEAEGAARLHLDLRPDVSLDELTQRLARARAHDSLSQVLRKNGGLSKLAASLLRESGAALARDPASLAQQIKNASVQLTGARPIVRAISSAGGVRFEEVDEHLMLRRLPGVFVCGEMLDWEAPTGGYLLQAVFATGLAAGRGAAHWLGLR